MELKQCLVVEALDVQRLGLDDRHPAGHPTQALQAGERLFHVVEHSEVEDDVEATELVEVDRLEVGHQRLDLRAEGGGGELEAAATREVRLPEVGLVPGLVGEGAAVDAFGPIRPTGLEVDAPGVVVQGHDPGCARLLGHEGVLAVPGPDVEHALARDVGDHACRRLLGAVTLGHDAVAEVDGVVPTQGVGLCLHFRRICRCAHRPRA